MRQMPLFGVHRGCRGAGRFVLRVSGTRAVRERLVTAQVAALIAASDAPGELLADFQDERLSCQAEARG